MLWQRLLHLFRKFFRLDGEDRGGVVRVRD